MISATQIYNVVAAIVPLYVPMILAYASVRWWKIFTPEQCSGINSFVAMFAVPFLNFHFLATNDPFAMNLRFIGADTLQKLVILGALLIWTNFTKYGSLDWTITLFSLSSLPNTVIVGVPLLSAMYGDSTISLMSQIFVMQGVVWFTLMLFLYELRGSKTLISNQFPEPLQPDVEKMRENGGEPHATVRRSHSYPFNNSCNCSNSPSMKRASSFNTIRDLQEGMSKIHEERMRKTNSCSDHFNGVKHESIDTSSSPKAMEVGFVNGIQYPLSKDVKEVKIEEKIVHENEQTPHFSVKVRLILTMVWRNLIRNPNTYACVFGLSWSLVSFRWSIKMPSIVNNSILMLSKTGTGMAMFSVGQFMALQPKTIACGKTWSAISMVVRFLISPAVVALTSIVMGIRGDLLRVAIVQAALPQAIVSFVFAKEYNLHADIMSTSVIFGTVISLPITLIYFVLLGL